MLKCVSLEYQCCGTGLIQPGDELRQVNGVEVTGKQPDDVIQLIVSKIRHFLYRYFLLKIHLKHFGAGHCDCRFYAVCKYSDLLIYLFSLRTCFAN